LFEINFNYSNNGIAMSFGVLLDNQVLGLINIIYFNFVLV